jgi:NDP-sugar pyrophosphorylase family protein
MVLALSGDSYVDIRLAEFQEWQQSTAFPSAALLVWAENCGGHVMAEVDPTGRIAAFREKRGLAEAGWIDSGVYLLPRAWIEALPADLPLSLERDALPFWIESGMGGYCTHAQYIDIGTPEGLAQAPSFFASLRRKRSPRLAAGLYLV